MKQQVKPGVMIAAIIGVLAVIGIVIFFINNRPASTSSGSPPVIPTSQPAVRDKSPDDIVKEHMKQMPQGGGQ
ncbi:MAG: hypothetical protein JWL77_4461 [Chthonomonadaceae bacterium]|nr:hypothetical protein [Chthonomonadaceae bacterium]